MTIGSLFKISLIESFFPSSPAIGDLGDLGEVCNSYGLLLLRSLISYSDASPETKDDPFCVLYFLEDAPI